MRFFGPINILNAVKDADAALPEETPVIEIRNLHKAYGALEVIKGVDITAHKGEVISLIGSSGSGKSTILRCANLLEDSQQGDILFKGEPVAWKGEGLNRHPADPKQVLRIRTNLSMVFQQFNLWAHLSILENVMEAPVTVLGRDRAEVESLGSQISGSGGHWRQMRCLPGAAFRWSAATGGDRTRAVHGTRSAAV